MIITLDAETYYDDDFTLKKMTTEAYIRDHRFQTLLWAVKINDKPAIYRSPEVLLTDTRFRAAIESSAVLCHHAHFDGLILSHHFGLKPKAWLDTYSMARFLHGPSASLSLAALAAEYKLPPKIIDYESFKGRRLENLSPEELSRLGSGAARDADTTYDLFCAMAREFPAVEYPIIDLTIRMFTEPKLVGDVELFASIRDTEFLSKNERLYELGVGEKDLQSAAKFCALLEMEGVDIEYKDGSGVDENGAPKQIPAIAKTDSFMRGLVESDDERVAALATARLEVKSTLAETRAGRLHGMATRGPLSIYLYYCGAHTRRWSGGDDTNFQNLTRGAAIRRGIKAPDGHLIAAPDQSQGECRILNWLAGQEDVLERFRQGADPYIPIASKFYGRPITREDTAERGFGKQSELSCGFGCGWAKFQTTAYRGTYGPSIVLSDDDSKAAVNLYRSEHPFVTKLWDEGTWAIGQLHAKNTFTWRVLQGSNGRLHHPNGSWLDYNGLFWSEGEWRLRGRRGGWSKMYGSKLVENVVQWLSRIVTCEAMLRFKEAGVPIVGMAHDDVWLLVNQCDNRDQLDELKRKISAMMAVTPTWAPGLPMAADCKIGATYS